MGCIDVQFLAGLFNPCAVLINFQINCGSFDFSAPTSGAFDLEIGPYSGEFDQSFLKKSNASGFARRTGDDHFWN